MFACDDSTSIVCAREIRGSDSSANPVTPVFAWNADQHGGIPREGAGRLSTAGACSVSTMLPQTARAWVGGAHGVATAHNAAAIALPTSAVVALPPMSGVRGAEGSARTRS